jgi:hypothetical protein
MDMMRQMDIYCERLDPSFWAEPLNAISNLAFILAAFLAYRLLKKAGSKNPWDWVLVALIALMGIGSFLFHTYAQFWAMMADVLPITFFIYIYLFLALRRLIMLDFWPATGAFAALVAFDAFVLRPLIPPSADIPWANGSQDYAFPFIAMGVVLAVMMWRKTAGAGQLALALGIFTVSLTLRTLDMAVCDSLAIGTHYFWHMLNAWMLYVLARLIFSISPVGKPAVRPI